MEQLREMGYLLIGLDGEADQVLEHVQTDQPIALVMGAEGPGLRDKTKQTCDSLARIDASGGFGSLNVSNASAIALYAVRPKQTG